MDHVANFRVDFLLLVRALQRQFDFSIWRAFRQRAGTPKPLVWQHDLVQSDGTPYKEFEYYFFRHMIFGKDIPVEVR